MKYFFVQDELVSALLIIELILISGKLKMNTLESSTPREGH